MGEPRIVAAAMSLYAHGTIGHDPLRPILEEADVRATLDCLAEGISIEDGDAIRARKQQYRDEALARHPDGA